MPNDAEQPCGCVMLEAESRLCAEHWDLLTEFLSKPAEPMPKLAALIKKARSFRQVD